MPTTRTSTLLALPLLLALAAPQDVDHEVIEARYFALCDHDQNGWISYAEARTSLKATRGEFKVYDQDRDGRIGTNEFHKRYVSVVDLTGAFPEPKIGDKAALAVMRSPTELRSVYDKDADNAIDKTELSQLLTDYGREELSAALLLTKLDRDLNSKLEAEELSSLTRLLAGPRLKSTSIKTPEALPKTVEQLFGAPVPRPETVDATPLPPRIAGPVPVFHRLDLDADGKLSIEDLRGLQSPLQLKARAGAVLATLDANEDGTVSPEEFRASMSSSSKP